MANLYVFIHDPAGQSIDDVTVYWSVPEGEEREGEMDLGRSRPVIRNVPGASPFTLRLERQGAPDLWVTLDLDERSGGDSDRRFVHGRPTIMRLRREQIRNRPLAFTLDITIYDEPQEVIFCAGRNTHNNSAPSPFPNLAVDRFARMAVRQPSSPRQGVVQVNLSCVLTLFEFNQDNSKVHFLLPGRGTPELAQSRRRQPVYAMKTFAPSQWRDYLATKFNIPDSAVRRSGRLSILDVYDYLESIGKYSDRRGTIMALEFFSHAYGIGPVLENTSRARDNIMICNELCPVDCMHGGTGGPMPRARWSEEESQVQVTEIIGLPRFHLTRDPDRSTPEERGIKTSIETSSRVHVVSHDPLRSSAAHMERESSDLDPRNTDFAPGIMGDELKGAIQQAFHDQAHLRVWGCHNGDMGPRWREAMNHINGPDNEFLAIESNKGGYYRHNGREVEYRYRQLWKVRRRDLKLLYYSLAHRSYAQAIATALERPCYAALPGTGSEYVATRRLGGMSVDGGMANRIRRFVASLANFNEQDEALYYRFDPNITPYDEHIKVLLAGFVPFRMPERRDGREEARGRDSFARYNSAQLAVAKVHDLEGSSNRVLGYVTQPPWINLSLDVDTQPNVDVIWPSDLQRTRVERAAERPYWARADIAGSEALAQRARETQADIVVIVGGSPNLTMIRREGDAPRTLADLRVEMFARNYGLGQRPGGQPVLDNDGFYLNQTGEIFPGEPDLLETTVPRRVWTYVDGKLNKATFTVHVPDGRIRGGEHYTLLNSAGSYICNESFYRLIREARSGAGETSASGRWVCLVHIAALSECALSERTRFDLEVSELALALQVVIGALVEEMLWAREPYGRVPPADPDQNPIARTCWDLSQSPPRKARCPEGN